MFIRSSLGFKKKIRLAVIAYKLNINVTQLKEKKLLRNVFVSFRLNNLKIHTKNVLGIFQGYAVKSVCNIANRNKTIIVFLLTL